jgi:transposase
LTLEQAVLAYREEYLIERGFGRLKGKPLSLTPLYLQRDERAKGLVGVLADRVAGYVRGGVQSEAAIGRRRR